MATQKRMKLPSLKLTQRSGGVVRHRTFPRGMTNSMVRTGHGLDNETSQASPETVQASIEYSADASLVEDGESPMPGIDDSDRDHSGPSLHSIKQLLLLLGKETGFQC